MEFSGHVPVLLDKIILQLKTRFGKDEPLSFADCTFGGGGHSSALLTEFPNSSLAGFDQDPDVMENAKKNVLPKFEGRNVELFHANFRNFSSAMGKRQFNFIMADLGVSSHQFDTGERGFSFRSDAPLDMRMNYNNDDINSASDILNNYSEEEIANLIYEYGEERLSRRIAKAIVEERSREKITTTKQLENICFHAYPKNNRHGKIHPATRTFQAMRIAVNDELGAVTDLLNTVCQNLLPGGLLAIITFHSLEDRIVKHSFKSISKENSEFKILTKKPILPSESEILANSRSRSAKLRLLERAKENEK